MERVQSRSRIAIIVTAWLGVVAVAGVAYWLVAGDAALQRGRQRYLYRETVKQQVERTAAARPTVVWIGDSTIIGMGTISYPQIVKGGLPGVSFRVIGFPGCDYFSYYPIVGDLLSRYRPAVLVMVAHLRLFRPPSADPNALVTRRNDLASMIPTSELGHAIRLPFESRGLTLPRLALARLLRWHTVETAFYAADGARAQYGEADIPWMGPPNTTDLTASFLRLLDVGLGGSNVAVTRHHPTVRMMEATVRLARDAGVRVIVVGSPLPFEAMRDSVIGYDPAVYAERFAVIADAVRDAGGVFVDLHEALPRAMFHDVAGHFEADGATVLAKRLQPVVVSELAQATSASPRRDGAQN
jgi:hypothetical protein